MTFASWGFGDMIPGVPYTGDLAPRGYQITFDSRRFGIPSDMVPGYHITCNLVPHETFAIW